MKEVLTTIGSVFAAGLTIATLTGPETNRTVLKQADAIVSEYKNSQQTVDETVKALEFIFRAECERQQSENSLSPFASKKVREFSWDYTLGRINNRIEAVLKDSGAEICKGACEAGSFKGRRVMELEEGSKRWLSTYNFPTCDVPPRG